MNKKPYQVLILEDDLETLSVLFKAFSASNFDIAPVVLSQYWQVEKLINNSDLSFDVILLDRDCNLGGSFHQGTRYRKKGGSLAPKYYILKLFRCLEKVPLA